MPIGSPSDTIASYLVADFDEHRSLKLWVVYGFHRVLQVKTHLAIFEPMPPALHWQNLCFLLVADLSIHPHPYGRGILVGLVNDRLIVSLA